MRTTVLMLVLLLCSCPAQRARAGSAPQASRAEAVATSAAPAPAPPDAQPADDAVQVDESANGSAISLKAGQQLQLRLDSDTASGMQWELARTTAEHPYVLDEAILKFISREVLPGALAEPLPPDEPPTPPEPPQPDPPGPPRPPEPPVPPHDPPQPPDPDQPPDAPPDAPPLPPVPPEPPQPPPPGPDEPQMDKAMELWTFEGLIPGTVVLRLEYRRPWEKDAQPARSFELTVSVEPALQ